MENWSERVHGAGVTVRRRMTLRFVMALRARRPSADRRGIIAAVQFVFDPDDHGDAAA